MNGTGTGLPARSYDPSKDTHPGTNKIIPNNTELSGHNDPANEMELVVVGFILAGDKFKEHSK